MMHFVKTVFCKHEEVRVLRKVFGDEINLRDGKRFFVKCRKCHREFFHEFDVKLEKQFEAHTAQGEHPAERVEEKENGKTSRT